MLTYQPIYNILPSSILIRYILINRYYLVLKLVQMSSILIRVLLNSNSLQLRLPAKTRLPALYHHLSRRRFQQLRDLVYRYETSKDKRYNRMREHTYQRYHQYRMQVRPVVHQNVPYKINHRSSNHNEQHKHRNHLKQEIR